MWTQQNICFKQKKQAQKNFEQKLMSTFMKKKNNIKNKHIKQEEKEEKEEEEEVEGKKLVADRLSIFIIRWKRLDLTKSFEVSAQKSKECLSI
jgi:hypothetical protein